jgi:hypothetical protein
MFAKRSQWILNEYVNKEEDDDDARGGWSQLEAIPVAFPPSSSFDGGLLSLCFLVFDLRLSIIKKISEGIYRWFFRSK